MIKLIHSGDVDPSVDAGMRIENDRIFTKTAAATIFNCDYSDLKPDDRHVGIHVVALGDAEHYPANRNGDLFSKAACVKYHDTFVKHGHVYRHHRNKDPQKSIGQIKASAYNPKMGRIELYIHADKDKAAPELERLEKDGEIPFSMACRVMEDRCSICGNMRKQAGSDSECAHVRDHLGELQEDGRKVATFNDEPDFFDISFVGRPADRIAWNLKVASGIPVDSVKAAEYEGVVAPDELSITSETGIRKLAYAKQLAELQRAYTGWIAKSASVVSVRDKYLYELHKIASSRLTDAQVENLRRLPPKVAFAVLGKSGVIMDVPTFFKYATGNEYNQISEYIPATSAKTAAYFDKSVENGTCQDMCNDTTFDADFNLARAYDTSDIEKDVKSASAIANADDLILTATMEHTTPEYSNFIVDNPGQVCSNDLITEKLAEKYAAYKLSAIDAIINSRNDNQLTVVALAATQNLQK